MKPTHELEPVTPKAATDKQVLEAYHAAEGAMEELKQSPLFKSASRKAWISGLLLDEKKKELGHGAWLPWCEKHKVVVRTAQSHMETAHAACASLQIRNDCVFDGMPLHRVLELPAAQVPAAGKETREKADALIEEKTAKQIVFEWKEAEATERKHGGAMEIKFHCPVCNHGLKGVAGRNVKCPGCSNTCKAKPDVKDKTDEDRAAASQALLDLAGQLNHEVDTATGDAPQTSRRALASDEAWQTLVDACLRITTFKGRSAKPAANKPATKRKK